MLSAENIRCITAAVKETIRICGFEATAERGPTKLIENGLKKQYQLRKHEFPPDDILHDIYRNLVENQKEAEQLIAGLLGLNG